MNNETKERGGEPNIVREERVHSEARVKQETDETKDEQSESRRPLDYLMRANVNQAPGPALQMRASPL